MNLTPLNLKNRTIILPEKQFYSGIVQNCNPGHASSGKTIGMCSSGQRGFPAPSKFTVDSVRTNNDNRMLRVKRGS